MVESRFELFTLMISRIYQDVQKIKATEMAEYELKTAHVNCLFVLARHPEGLTSAELTRMCGEDKAAVSRALRMLQEKEMIWREAAERKKYKIRIFLTEKGKKIADGTLRKIASAVKYAGGGLSAEERQLLYRLLGRVGRNLAAYTKQIVGQEMDS